jgi:hypothetical protein
LFLGITFSAISRATVLKGKSDMVAKTEKPYTIHLCHNGKEFKRLSDVVAITGTGLLVGDVIEHKWRVVGVLENSTPMEMFVDVEKVAE